MKFLCDAMLHGLAKWLRAAGYDTKIVPNTMIDQDVLHQALSEDRVLLTRDAHFLEMKEATGSVIFFTENSVDSCLIALIKRCNLNMLERAFTRCLVCNTLFEPADPKRFQEQVPPDVLATQKEFFYCPCCDKVFWQASHTEHMRKKLEEWQKKIN